MKSCKSCQTEKPLDDFHKNQRSGDGHQSNCRDCCSEYSKEYRKSNVVILREKKRKQENYKKLTQDDRRSLKYLSRYGITLDEYEDMHKAQDGVCAICFNPPSGKKKRLCVDHCHDTGKVRGLLCNDCNVGIGRLKDDVDLLVSAITYLEGGS